MPSTTLTSAPASNKICTTASFPFPESSTYRSAPRSEKVDHDDIDMEGDEFQDDDENVGLEPDNDEDSKDMRERLRRNHLGANLFGDADEREVDKEEEEDKAARKKGQLGNQLRKALAKREVHLEYLEYVDSDTNSEKEDFLELSSEDEEDEEDKDKKEEEKKADGKDGKDGKDKPGTATGTPKGSTTPQGKKSAETAAGKEGKSLKRPGSPNLSESSGNESSRKKIKKHANGGSVRPSCATTPPPGKPPRAKIIKSSSSTGAGAPSDGEATGGEMFDGPAGSGAGKRRIKIVGPGVRSTPSGSRASSPNPTAALSPGSNPGSLSGRAGSPGSPTSTSRAASPSADGSGNMDAQEIINALRKIPEGITVGGLLKQFGSRIGDGRTR